MMGHKNETRIKVVANALAELNQTIVFVGGAVVGLYCDDAARIESRPTDDVDVVIEILSRSDYAKLEEKLRQIGFQPDRNSPVICRYKYHDIVVDIMPSEGEILGFTNRWYHDGVSNTVTIKLDDDVTIKVFEVAYFLASKMEALKSVRRGNDFRWNSDFEDIIYLFDNRTTLSTDLLQANEVLKNYFKDAFAQILDRPNIYEEVAANLEFPGQNERRARIVKIWEEIAH